MVAFAPGAVLTAANLNTAFNALTIRTTTGVTDTLVLADNGGAVTFSNAAAIAVTIPLNSSVAYAVGTKIVLINLGAGVVTVAGAVGVTVNGTPLTLAQNAGATCVKTATNTWSFLPFSSGVGNAVYSDANTGTYTGFAYITFTASGTLTVTTAGFADIVVEGGGAAGGFATDVGQGGGGGAGGALVGTAVFLPVGTLTVIVGGGGAATAANVFGLNGSASRLGTLYGVGGGGGGAFSGVGAGGGSAGGGGGSNNTGAAGASGLSGQGNNGGSAGSTTAGGGGGGGGAVGGNGAGTTGGNGGAGATTTIAGTTPSGAYVAGTFTFAGGGGGCGSVTAGAGGSGGGGIGAVNTGAAGNGSVNTGGGGGGRNGSPGTGGSGIVIVRVAV